MSHKKKSLLYYTAFHFVQVLFQAWIKEQDKNVDINTKQNSKSVKYMNVETKSLTYVFYNHDSMSSRWCITRNIVDIDIKPTLIGVTYWTWYEKK